MVERIPPGLSYKIEIVDTNGYDFVYNGFSGIIPEYSSVDAGFVTSKNSQHS